MSLLLRVEEAEARHLTLYGGEVATFGAVRAVNAGPDLPINVAAGFGNQEDAPLDAVEDFFARRGLPARLTVWSEAHPALLARVAARGYQLKFLLHAHARTLGDLPDAPALAVERVDGAAWLPLALRAFGPGSEGIMALIAQRPSTRLYVAAQGGEPLGVGALTVLDGVALLHTAATLPEQRRRGAQAALIAARLHEARAAGADMASVLTSPGSASERNVRRFGFGMLGARLSFDR